LVVVGIKYRVLPMLGKYAIPELHRPHSILF
jgi:hypothetical protein